MSGAPRQVPRRLRQAARVLIAILGLAAPWYGRAGEAASTASTASGPAVGVREGYLVNFEHRYYLPLAGHWTLAAGAERDYQSLTHASLPGVVVQILVAGEGTADLAESIGALREKAGEDPRTRVLGESGGGVGMRESRELLALREPAAAGQPVVLVRTIAFLRSPSKYYLRLESPAASFEKASRDFDEAVAGFKFEFRLFASSAP